MNTTAPIQGTASGNMLKKRSWGNESFTQVRTGTATALQRYSSQEHISESDKAGVAFHDSSFFTSTRGGLKKNGISHLVY